MDRETLVNAIVEQFKKLQPLAKEHLLREALRHIASDTTLLTFAAEHGVDTRALFEVRS